MTLHERVFTFALSELQESVARLLAAVEADGIPAAAWRAADAAGSSTSLVLLATRVVVAAAIAQEVPEFGENGCTRSY